jgi:hypothetical protein
MEDLAKEEAEGRGGRGMENPTNKEAEERKVTPFQLSLGVLARG